MSDPLEHFKSVDANVGEDARAGHEHTLLLFEHGSTLYGVSAFVVDSLVAWRKPAPLPASVPGLAGVVQDRGRIVSVLTSPLARPDPGGTPPRRIVICATQRGLIGLPCAETRQVGTIVLADEPQSGEVTDSSSGAVVYVDPERIARELRLA